MESSGCKDMGTSKMQRITRRRKVARKSSVVQRKVKKLQKLIPGGRRLSPDRLFLRTADYILHLRFQLHMLQAVSDQI
ncbi:hypothetical protein RHSIM_Rhsim12G0048000 [Rhododendron simsii]|uniref:Uncharacterized protein n=1 Tax=Rhododendron simsii TaxID=118357 RepID=A0A834G6D4_RHOSS|nr:hypothetical protein RHSIM_Rhsim12G0048000 [Rhododendron simsii]